MAADGKRRGSPAGGRIVDAAQAAVGMKSHQLCRFFVLVAFCGLLVAFGAQLVAYKSGPSS